MAKVKACDTHIASPYTPTPASPHPHRIRQDPETPRVPILESLPPADEIATNIRQIAEVAWQVA